MRVFNVPHQSLQESRPSNISFEKRNFDRLCNVPSSSGYKRRGESLVKGLPVFEFGPDLFWTSFCLLGIGVPFLVFRV